jgi:ubiquinone/menaquinone biosynthesis C-methylase UbiE
MGAPCVLASLGASDPEARKHHLNGHPIDRTSAQAFGRIAEQYERMRPTYREEIVSWLVDRLGLGPGRTVVDVGAGTGKLTRQLVASGARIIAVEPLAEMRAQFALVLPNGEIVDGTAEALPLDDASADAVTAAAAFHWFDLDRALPEFHRVLRPGGALAVVRNYRDLRDPVQASVQQIIGAYVPDERAFEAWKRIMEATLYFDGPQIFQTTHEQLVDAHGLAERVGTTSYVARLPDGERADVLDRVRVVGTEQPEEVFAFRYRSDAYVFRRRDADYPLSR